ncbi:MAG: 50S ribosomal protein L29 [Alphaproteobacteria bacterium]
MAKEKIKKINYGEKTLPELKTALLDLRRAQFNLRFRKTQGNLEQPLEVRKNRRDIARIKTYLTMKSKKQKVKE